MSDSDKLRFVCILLLWLCLCYLLLTRTRPITLMTVFTVVASGIIVFVPLYKKYKKKKND